MLTLLTLAVLTAIFAWAWQQKEKQKANNPLMNMKDNQLCEGPHKWAKAAFLMPNELEGYHQNPDLYLDKSTTYCQHCGFIPSMDLMVKDKFLKDIAEQEARILKAQQDKEDLEYLTNEFFNQWVEASPYKNQRDLLLLAEGFKVHMQFVKHLPELMAARKIAREREIFITQVADTEHAKQHAY